MLFSSFSSLVTVPGEGRYYDKICVCVLCECVCVYHSKNNFETHNRTGRIQHWSMVANIITPKRYSNAIHAAKNALRRDNDNGTIVLGFGVW